MEKDYILLIGFCSAMIVLCIVIFSNRSSDKDKVIKAQQDTIQRLINREPVTYQETNQKHPKIIEETYSAWGNVTVEREVDDSRE